MSTRPTPAPDRGDGRDTGINGSGDVVDYIEVHDIEIVDEPVIIIESSDLIHLDPISGPGPIKVESDQEEAKAWAALLGPEVVAGLSLVVLFLIFAIVLTGGAPEQPRDSQDNPVAETADPAVAPVAPIEVEIGEALTIERE